MANKRNPQLKLLKDTTKAYGGDLLKARKGRSMPRPLTTKDSIHLVLRSTKAVGPLSFWKHKDVIRGYVKKFSGQFGVKIHSIANVGNHLHFHLKLSNRHTYKFFIRALTGAIAQTITKSSRLNTLQKGFWDRRPFTNVLKGFKGFITLRDYVGINQLEGIGFQREQARFYLAWNQIAEPPP
jgi:REP element-mobilizing transposase RayT